MALIFFVALGIIIGVVGVEFGLLSMAIAAVLAVAVAVTLRNGSGPLVLVALGATWTILFTNAAWTCAGAGQPCGATPLDMTPHVIASLALLILGIWLALWPRRKGAATS